MKYTKTILAFTLVLIFVYMQVANGATVLSTATTDTIDTFRTNVNTSLTNLNNAITSILSGSSTAGYVAYFSDTTTVSGSSSLFFDTTNLRLGIGTGAPSSTLHVIGTSTLQTAQVTSVLTVPNGAGGTTVGAAGQITVDTTAGTLNFHDGTSEKVLTASSSKAWAIESPTAGDKFGAVFFDAPATVRKVACVNKSSGDNVTFNYGIGTNRASSTSILFTIGGLACNAASTTTYGVTFNDAAIPANSWVWPTFSAASSTETDITLFYTTNP